VWGDEISSSSIHNTSPGFDASLTVVATIDIDLCKIETGERIAEERWKDGFGDAEGAFG